MNIVLKTKNITLDNPLEDFCKRVIQDLEKYVNVLDSEKENKNKATVQGWIEIGKTTLHHKKGPFFRAECQIFLPGKIIRAQSEEKYLRQSLTCVKNEIKKELKKYKDKIKAQQKRGQRQFKKSLNLSTNAKIKKSKGGRIREEGI